MPPATASYRTRASWQRSSKPPPSSATNDRPPARENTTAPSRSHPWAADGNTTCCRAYIRRRAGQANPSRARAGQHLFNGTVFVLTWTLHVEHDARRRHRGVEQIELTDAPELERDRAVQRRQHRPQMMRLDRLQGTPERAIEPAHELCARFGGGQWTLVDRRSKTFQTERHGH